MAGARPGSLERLTDERPDEVVLRAPGVALTRAGWEAAAGRLADTLAARGVRPGELLCAPDPLLPAWHVAAWAAAKLGAGLLALPPLAAPPDAVRPIDAADLDAALAAGRGFAAATAMTAAFAADPPAARRVTGEHPPPDALTRSPRGRTVRRSFPPERVAAVGPVLADLVARLRLAPGTALLLGPASATDATLAFAATVALVGGGRVTVSDELPAALAAGKHGALALSPAGLASLSTEELDDVDLLAVDSVLTGGAPVPATVRAWAEDQFGPGALLDVLTTADTGVIGVRAGSEPGFALLEGVSARAAGGRLEVRSPLAVGDGWTATGDRAEVADGRVILRP